MTAWVSFLIRGGIIDVFPLTEESPVRIELWDDEVDSIRTFDLESQRSIEQLDSVTIYPAAEVVVTPELLAQGIEAMEKEAKAYEKTLRSQKRIEEASRIRSVILGACRRTEGRMEGIRPGCVCPVFL